MRTDSHKWKGHITEAEGPLPHHITLCLDTRVRDSISTFDTMCRSIKFISQFIRTISDEADSRYLLTYSEDTFVALKPSPSGSSTTEGETQLFWTIAIENQHIGAGRHKGDKMLDVAMRDVRETAVVCNGPQYLPVDGTFAYAAAGHKTCFIYLDLNGNETFRSRIFDTHFELERAHLLEYVAGIYRALLVTQKCFKANQKYPLDTENVWERRDNSCQVMRRNDKCGRRFIKEWEECILQAYLATRGTTMAIFKQVHALGNGINGLPKAKVEEVCSLQKDLVIVEMDLYGPDLAHAPPQDEQSFKAACHGLLGALIILHGRDLVHCGIKAANLVWIDDSRRDAIVLVDLDTACQTDTAMPEECRPHRWDHVTLDMHGCYGKASDVHEAGKLLKRLAADKPWSASAAEFCNQLIGMQWTASNALGHRYLAS
ncbi:hypothetical protein COCOBI_10-0130 [Coccomyxa sp. Obi]|nr:hypothetical protein COCOBI_10-0130 [Coccomyxa sp. Obi]